MIRTFMRMIRSITTAGVALRTPTRCDNPLAPDARREYSLLQSWFSATSRGSAARGWRPMFQRRDRRTRQDQWGHGNARTVTRRILSTVATLVGVVGPVGATSCPVAGDRTRG